MRLNFNTDFPYNCKALFGWKDDHLQSCYTKLAHEKKTASYVRGALVKKCYNIFNQSASIIWLLLWFLRHKGFSSSEESSIAQIKVPIPYLCAFSSSFHSFPSPPARASPASESPLPSLCVFSSSSSHSSPPLPLPLPFALLP